ncbi:WD repeat and FYVE domain-containing protein 3 [Bulinus truncatus]|nr:WD repeat and FYVE domain-containing protein 3 [Bulinus truncatus]
MLKVSQEAGSELVRSQSSEFEVIGDQDLSDLKKSADDLLKKYKPLGKNTLREGFCWQRQLVFRSKLTMHTAYERKDNKEPAAVTAISISNIFQSVKQVIEGVSGGDGYLTRLLTAVEHSLKE